MSDEVIEEIEEEDEQVLVKTYRTSFYFIRTPGLALDNFQDRLVNLKKGQQAHVDKFVTFWLMQKMHLIKQEDNLKVPILPPKGQFDKDLEKFKKKIFSYLLLELRKQKTLTEDTK